MASLARSCRRASYDGSDRKRSGDAALVVAGLRASTRPPLAVVGGSDQSTCRAAAEPADLNSKPKSVCDPRHRAHVNNLLIDQAG